MYLVAVNVALPFGSAQVYNIITMCYLSGSILDCLSVAHLGVFGKIKQFSTLGHCNSIEGFAFYLQHFGSQIKQEDPLNLSI
jgi:hypothetical protein